MYPSSGKKRSPDHTLVRVVVIKKKGAFSLDIVEHKLNNQGHCFVAQDAGHILCQADF